jgi:hypothetical protein
MAGLQPVPRYMNWILVSCPWCEGRAATFVAYNAWFRLSPRRDAWVLICLRCRQPVTTRTTWP